MLNNVIALLGGGAASFSGFLGYLSSAGNKQSRGIAVDSSGNMLIAATATAFPGYAFIGKIATSGASITWQRQLGNGTDGFSPADCLLDSSGNSYWVGTANVSGNSIGSLLKYNSSGTLQWQRQLTTFSDVNFYKGSLDSLETSVYLANPNNAGGSGYIALGVMKWSSSGSITWQKKLQSATGDLQSFGLCMDSSDNNYVVGRTIASPSKLVFSKRNSSGTVQFQREISNASSNTGNACATDSTSVYITGTSDTKIITAKYNTSGTLQWSRLLTNASGSSIGNDIGLDTAGNVYIAGNTFSGLGFLAKYDSSGTLQWQRTLSTSATITLESLVVKTDGLYFNGKIGNEIFYGLLPQDGSKTGTWTVGSYSVTVAAGSLTDAASGFTDAAASYTDFTPTTTATTPTYTDSAASQTNNIKAI